MRLQFVADGSPPGQIWGLEALSSMESVTQRCHAEASDLNISLEHFLAQLVSTKYLFKTDQLTKVVIGVALLSIILMTKIVISV